MMLRYIYVLRSSWLRALEVAYWPAVQLLTWGFLQTYFASAGVAQSGPARLAGTLIGAVLLWDILLRTQQGFSFSFLEEIWSRNLANLMMSPLRMSEFVIALMAMSIIRLAIGVVPVIFLAIALFDFNLWSLGAAVGAFFIALALFAWSIGLVVSGMLMRYGLGAESLAWSLMFIVQPFGCVYFPVSTLPAWLQPLALALPPTYVFEGLRAPAHRARLSVGPHAHGFRARRLLLRRRHAGLLPFARQGARSRLAPANGGMMAPRADILLTERGFFESRAKARAAIEAGLVSADGITIAKPSQDIAQQAEIVAESPHPFVSRGGVKLDFALEHFAIDVQDRYCLDLGASTGGFTDALLQRGRAPCRRGRRRLRSAASAHRAGPARDVFREARRARSRAQASRRAAEPRRLRRELHLADLAAGAPAVACRKGGDARRADQAAIRVRARRGQEGRRARRQRA